MERIQTRRATHAKAAEPTTAPTSDSAGSRPSMASAGKVVIRARGITYVKTSVSAPFATPLNTDEGHRAKSKMDVKRYVRLSTRTTKNAALTVNIHSEYRSSVLVPSSRSDVRSPSGEGPRPRSRKA